MMESADTVNDEEYAFDEFDEDSYINSPGKTITDANVKLKPIDDDIGDDTDDLDALMTNTVGLGSDEYGNEEFSAEMDSPLRGGTAEAIRATLTKGIIPAEISNKYERFFSFDAEEDSIDNKDDRAQPVSSPPLKVGIALPISPVEFHYSDDEGHVMFLDNNFDNFGNNEDDREDHEVSTTELSDKKDTKAVVGPSDEYEEEFYELELAPASDRKSSLKKGSPIPDAAANLELNIEDTRSGESGGEIDLNYISGLLANNAKILENAGPHTSESNNLSNTVPSSSSASPSPRGPTSSGGGPGYFNVLDVLSSEKIPTTNLNNTNTKKFVKVEEVSAKDISSLSFNVDSTGNTISIVSPSPVQTESVAANSINAAAASGSKAVEGGGVDVKRLSILKNKVTKVRGASTSSEASNGDRNSREKDSHSGREEPLHSLQHQPVVNGGAAGSKKGGRGGSGSEPPSSEAGPSTVGPAAAAAAAVAPPPPSSSSVMVSPLSSRKKSSTSDSPALAAANRKKAAAAAAKAAAQEEYDELMALVENPAAAAATAGGADDVSVSSQSSASKAGGGKGRGTIRGTVVRGTIARVNSNTSASSGTSAVSSTAAAALAALSDIQQKNAMLPMALPNKGISNAPTVNNRASIRKTVVAPARHVKKANVGVTPLISIIQKKPAVPAAGAAAKKPRRVGMSVPDETYEEDFNELEEGDVPPPDAAASHGSAAETAEGQDKSSFSPSPKKARSSVRFSSAEVVEGASEDEVAATAIAVAAAPPKKLARAPKVTPLNVQTNTAAALMAEGLVTPPREVDLVETSRSVPNKTTTGSGGINGVGVASAPKVRGASIRLYNPVPPAGGGINRTGPGHRAAGSIRRVVPPRGVSSDDRLHDSKHSSATGGIAAPSEVATPMVEEHPTSEGAPTVQHHKKQPADPYAKVSGTMNTQPVARAVRPSIAVHHTAADSHADKPHDPYAKVQGTMHTQPAKTNRAIIVQHHPHHQQQQQQHPPRQNQVPSHVGSVNSNDSAVDIEEVAEEEEEEGEETHKGRGHQNKALDRLVSDHREEADEYEHDHDFVEESLDSFEEASPSTHTIHNHSGTHQQHHHGQQHQESSAGTSTLSGNSNQSHYVTRLHQHVSIAGRMKNHLFPRANKDPFQMYDESSGLFSSFEVEYQRASRLEQYRIANAEKQRLKQIEIETARYSYMKRNQELLVEKHFKEMKLIRDNAQREERVEALRAQHIVAFEKIHAELEEIRLRMENLTQVQASYKNNYIRVAGNIMPPAPKSTSYQPAEPRRRVKYRNPVAAHQQAPRHFEQMTVQRVEQAQQQQSQEAYHHHHHHHQQQQQYQMKPTAPTHSKPGQGSGGPSSYKKGKFIKQMPPANAPRKAVPQASPPVMHVNEFGDLTGDASDLHSNPSNIVISEFYDQEDFNPEDTAEVEEAMNGVLLANHNGNNNNAGGGAGGGNESYHSLHNTNYSTLPVELVSVHSPINNVVKVTKTTMVIDVDKMAEDGADTDTPIGSAAVAGGGGGAKQGNNNTSMGKLSRDSSAGYHLYYDPDEEEEGEVVGLSPVKQRGGLDGGKSVIEVVEEEEGSISDSKAHGFMSDMVHAAAGNARGAAGVTTTFRSSGDYDDEGFEEEEHNHQHQHQNNNHQSAVGFYSMEFDGEDDSHDLHQHHHQGGGGSGHKPKRKCTPMRRVRAVDLEEDSDNDNENDNDNNHHSHHPQAEEGEAVRGGNHEYEGDGYEDAFEESEGGGRGAGRAGDGPSVEGHRGARGLMAGSITSLDYSGDFNNLTIQEEGGGGFPFSASSSLVLEGGSQVDSVFAQLDGESTISGGGGGATSVAGGKAKFEGIASSRLDSTYMSYNDDLNGEEESGGNDIIKDTSPPSVTRGQVRGADEEEEEDHYQDEEFETSGVLTSHHNNTTTAVIPVSKTVTEVPPSHEEEEEYDNDFNTTQAINNNNAAVAAAVATDVGGYDEEDEELLMMLMSAPASQKVQQQPAATTAASSAEEAGNYKKEEVEDEEDLYGDEDFH